MTTILRDPNDDSEVGVITANGIQKTFTPRPSQYSVVTTTRRMVVMEAKLVWELVDMGIDVVVFTIDGKRYTTDITEWTLQSTDMGDSYALPVWERRLG